MSQARVYLETSFVSYVAAALQKRISKDVNTAHRQLSSLRWWMRHGERFKVFISPTVIKECSSGHSNAARSRLRVLDSAETLSDNQEKIELTRRSIEPAGPLPRKAEADASHIAFASVYGCDYLLTWNFKHIANAMLQLALYKAVQSYGYQTSLICNPGTATRWRP